MGYFSNGTEGAVYSDTWCSNCQHYDQCPVWAAHLLYNYELCNDTGPGRAILDMLIPPTEDGLSNGQCAMFLRRA